MLFRPVRWSLVHVPTKEVRHAFTKKDIAHLWKLYVLSQQSYGSSFILIAQRPGSKRYQYDYEARDWREIK